MVFVHAVAKDEMPARFVAVNDVACKKLGHTREQLMAMTPLDIEVVQSASAMPRYTRAELVTMSDRDVLERENVFARRLVKRILGNPVVLYEREFLSRDGRRIPVEINARSFEFARRPVIMLVAHDITERKETQRALRTSEQRFKDFFANSPIGVGMFSPHRELVNINASCLRVFGVPEQEDFAGIDLFDGAFVPKPAKEALKRGESARYEATLNFDDLRNREGLTTTRKGTAHLDIWINNLGLDPDYKPKGYLVEVLDITKRREVEAALLNSERQLRQSQKMQAIGTLSGGIAHDFNNILTPILGYSEMILHSLAEDSAARGYVKEVLKASHRAKDLVNQILTFSRQTEQPGQVIRITPIVKEVVKLLRASTPEEIEVKYVVRAKHDIVLADPTQIHQVIMNLCTNAVHVMRTTGGQLEVRMDNFLIDQRTRRRYPSVELGRYLRISVRDTGSGMDAQTAERIFEPFFTTKPKGEGTGMGLAVVHGIVTGLKGTITVDTKLGEGSTFNVILPTVERFEEEEEEAAGPVIGGSESVLLVDDEAEIVKMGAQMLASLGYHPVVANDAEEALRIFELNPKRFDVVITDQVMPGMTGIEMAQRMLDMRTELPVIVCTGFSEALTPEVLENSGIHEFMLKPVGMRQLADAIRRVLSGKPAKPTNGSRPADETADEDDALAAEENVDQPAEA